jgi:terminase small subunit-like protein
LPASSKAAPFNAEIAAAICESIATSCNGLNRIANENGVSASSVYVWLIDNKEFAERYARAREVQQDLLGEEIIEIADDSARDTKVVAHGDSETEVADNEWINRSRLRVDTRKWLMSKLSPKKYGDRVQTEHSGEISVSLSESIASARKRLES